MTDARSNMPPQDTAPPRRRFRTDADDDNRTVADFIARRVPEAPAGFLNRLIRQGYVRVNGAPASASERLEPGLTVTLHLPPGAFLIYPNPEVPVSMVYEDESIAVVNKPAGLITEPGIGHKLDTLLNGLAARYGEALERLGPGLDFGMVHRLDKDTSGLLLVA
ncbi:MAG TPA: pseudouridine synthase, partial [Candidatus Brocadiia bacterium]|nr:pseudouridine synthase [Candidatus Brocadiia bacterium]